jgi:hypothetical protein
LRKTLPTLLPLPLPATHLYMYRRPERALLQNLEIGT